MSEKIKRLVDEYQVYEPLPGAPMWDLEALRRVFTLFTPTWIKNDTTTLPALPKDGGSYDQWSAGDDLPFPPALVEGITEEDIQALQETFGLRDGDRYSHWSEVYRKVNERFIESGEQEKAREIVSEIEILEKGRFSRCKLTSASLFLMSAQAYLMEHRKNEELKRRRGDERRNEIEGIEDYRKKVDRALKNLNQAIRGLEAQIREGAPEGIGVWIPKELCELKRVAEALEESIHDDFQGTFLGIEQIAELNLRASGAPTTRSENDAAVGAGEAYQGIKGWISKAHGTDYRASEKTKNLLEKWGLSINRKTFEKKQRRQDTLKNESEKT